MRKRIISAVLAMCMVLALLPVNAWASEGDGGDWENFGWSYDEDTETLTISGPGAMPKGNSYDLPFSSYSSSAVRLVVEDGVTSVIDNAFSGFTALVDVTFAGDVGDIGDDAFYVCKSLETLTFSGAVGNIGDNAFFGCAALKNLSFGGTVGDIGINAFFGCESLEALTFSGAVGDIKRDAFSDCAGLKSVSFGEAVGEIGSNAFDGCQSLETVVFSDTVGGIGAYAFYECAALKSVSFGGDVGDIGEEAFDGCESLETLAFSGAVGDIGDRAFFECAKLESLVFPQDVGNIGQNAFSGCAALKQLTFNGSAGDLEDGAFYGCAGLTRVEIPDGVTSIRGAFEACTGLTAVAIPASVTMISASAFAGCTALMDVYYGGDLDAWKEAQGDLALDGDRITLHLNASGLPDVDGVSSEDELLALFQEADGSRVDVVLAGSFTLSKTLTVPEGWNVVLDLNGCTLTSKANPAINMEGSMLRVLDSTASGPPSVSKDHKTVTCTSGSIVSMNGDAILLQPGRTLVLQSGHIRAGGCGVTVFANRAENGLRIETTAQISGAYIEAYGSAVKVLGDKAAAEVEDSVLLSYKAPVISGGEEKGDKATGISIRHSALIGRSGTDGQPACGIYHPQSGSVVLGEGTDLYVENGTGVLMRGGALTVNGSSGEVSIETGAGGAAIVMDQQGGPEYSRDWIQVTVHGEQAAKAFVPTAKLLEGYELRTIAGSRPGHASSVTYILGRVCTITLKLQNGEEDLVLTTENGLAPWPEKPTKPGYRFCGWATEQDAELIQDIVDEMYVFNSDRTLYAQWVPDGAWVVNFMLSSSAPDPRKVTDEHGKLADEDWPEIEFDAEGRRFLGWYDDDEEEEYSSDHVFTADCTLHARFEERIPPYQITFENNDGSGKTSVVETDGEGRLTKSGLPTDWPAPPEREGYHFLCWSWLDSDYYPAEEDDPFYGDSTLYALWVRDGGYKITFHPENGDKDQIVVNTDEQGFPKSWPADPKLNGSTFGGWFHRGLNEFLYGGERFLADTDLYAYWIKNGDAGEVDGPKEETYQITFHANGGAFPSGADKVTVSTGSDRRVTDWPDNPKREGWSFQGWFTAASGGKQVNAGTVFEESITVYAQWKQNSSGGEDSGSGGSSGGTSGGNSGGTSGSGASTPASYAIIFDPNGGTGGITLVTGTDGKLASLPGDPVYPGHTFTGWYTSESGGTKVTTSTVFSESTKVYAHWSQGGSSGASSSGSSSGSSAGYFQIRVSGGANGGSYTVSHDTAAAGTLVTINLYPWSNYVLSRLSAVRADTGGNLSLTGSRNQYTFTMPASDVQLVIAYTQSNSAAGGGYSEPPANSRPVNWYFSGGNICHVTSGIVPSGDPLTRDMLVSVLYNLDGSSFGIPTAWAASNGIVPDVYSSLLWGADKSVTREQTIMILYCYARHMGYSTYQRASLTGYTDSNQIRSVAVPAVSWGRAMGIMTGTSSNTLSPQAVVTCGQANIILSRFLSTM